MDKSAQKEKGKNIKQSTTFSVPFALGEIKEDITINTNTPSKLTKEQIINKALKFHSQGNLKAAEKYYKTVIDQGLRDQSIFSNYGSTLKDLGKLQEAEIFTRKAIKIEPNSAEINYNLGNILKLLRKLKEAEFFTRKAIEMNDKFENSHLNLGIILRDLGKPEDAIPSFLKAIELNPDCVMTKLYLEDVIQKTVPRWHISMINDQERNNAYLKAINLAIKNKDYVLEIGTGSGLLSMMAIDAGAKKVITCESNKSISKIASKIISKNGYKDKIRVINKKSTELTIGNDLSQKADLIISEIFSSNLVGEGVQATILDAKKRLLKSNGKLLPESGEIKFALIKGNSELEEQCFTSEINGYDLSDFNQITGKKFNIHIKGLNSSFLSNDNSAFSFDFYGNEEIKEKEKTIDIPVIKSGTCIGIQTWIKINVYQNIYLENKPSNTKKSHWSNPIYRFKKPLKLSKGEILKVKASILKDNVWFELIE